MTLTDEAKKKKKIAKKNLLLQAENEARLASHDAKEALEFAASQEPEKISKAIQVAEGLDSESKRDVAMKIAQNLSATEEHLDSLILIANLGHDHELADVLAQNQKISQRVQERIARSQFNSAKITLANNPVISTGVAVDLVSEEQDIAVRNAVLAGENSKKIGNVNIETQEKEKTKQKGKGILFFAEEAAITTDVDEMDKIIGECSDTAVIAALASNSFCPNEIQNFLAEFPDESVQIAIANNEKIPQKAQKIIAKSNFERARMQLALNQNASTEVLHMLSFGSSSLVQNAIVQNKNCPDSTISNLARTMKSTDTYDRTKEVLIERLEMLSERQKMLVAGSTPNKDALLLLSRDRSESVRVFVAENENADSQVLESLVFDRAFATERVRRAALENSNLSSDLQVRAINDFTLQADLEALAKNGKLAKEAETTLFDKVLDDVYRTTIAKRSESPNSLEHFAENSQSRDVLRAVAHNAKSSEKALEMVAHKAVEMNDEQLKVVLAFNENASEKMLEKIALNASEGVKISIAVNEKISQKMVEKLKSDEVLQTYLASNQGVEQKVLKDLASSESERVRLGVASNSSISGDLAVKLADDREAIVSDAAVRQFDRLSREGTLQDQLRLTSSGKLNDDHKLALSESNFDAVKLALASRQDLNTEQVEKLSLSDNEDIQQAILENQKLSVLASKNLLQSKNEEIRSDLIKKQSFMPEAAAEISKEKLSPELRFEISQKLKNSDEQEFSYEKAMAAAKFGADTKTLKKAFESSKKLDDEKRSLIVSELKENKYVNAALSKEIENTKEFPLEKAEQKELQAQEKSATNSIKDKLLSRKREKSNEFDLSRTDGHAHVRKKEEKIEQEKDKKIAHEISKQLKERQEMEKKQVEEPKKMALR